jgi:hypothetical protein
MKSIALIPITIWLVAGVASADHPAPGREAVKTIDWTLVTEEAGWQPRDSAGEYVYDNQLWVMGGWFTPREPNPRDVWKSPDGKQWTRVLETAPWEYSDLPASLVFRDKMWMMGGRKLPGTEVTNEVWASEDGAQWQKVGQAGWSPRLAPGFAVFQDKMWILGGTSDYYQNNDQTLMNDVWSSADGRQWKLETADAGWAKRTHGQAAAFDGKLWILGGGQRAPDVVVRNDVWSSEDGVHWKQVTESAPWEPRLWFSSLVYRDRMWVLGGWSDAQGNFEDVWYTQDGKNWTQLKSDVVWSKRHELSAFVFQDKIWVTAGAAGPDNILSGQVWNLHIPAGWLDE